MANENEQHLGSTSAVISNKNLRKLNENIYSSPSPFSRVKVTDTYKRLSHQAYVRDDTNRIENDNSIGDAVGDGDGGTDNDMKSNKKEGAGATVAVNAIATTIIAVSGEEVCVPPITVTDTSKLDTGHLPLSSCSSKKQLCIKSNKNDSTLSSSSIKKTGECVDMWDIPPSYLDTTDPNNDVQNYYWEDPYSPNIAGTGVSYKAGSYADDPSSSSEGSKNEHLQSNHWEDPSPTDGSKKKDSFSIHGEDPYAYLLFGSYPEEDARHLQELIGTSTASGSSQTSFDCESECNANPQPVKVTGSEFRDLVTSCIGEYGELDCKQPYGPLICWNTSLVDNMDFAFRYQGDFNSPLECWNVSQVTTMRFMFSYAEYFNQPLESWDVSQVEDMGRMFNSAYEFNQPLDRWDIRQVEDMERMFYYAFSFNQCLSTWAKKTTTVNTVNLFKTTECPQKGSPDPDNGPWCQTADICPITTCEDNKKVQFKVPNQNGKKKITKCNKIKKKDCDTKFKLKKKSDGVSKGKPKDFCQETCNPTLCCKDGTDKDYKIKNKKGEKVKGKFSCKKIKKKGYCKGKLKTGQKLRDVCKASCGQC